MICVIDASAAIAFETKSGNAPALLEVLADAERVITPDLFVAEVANVCWKHVQWSQFSVEDAQNLFRRCMALVHDTIRHDEIGVQALNLAIAFKVPAYDMFYLALAKQRDARLLTADAKLARLAGRLDIEV